MTSALLFIPGVAVSALARWHLDAHGQGHWNNMLWHWFDNEQDGIFGPYKPSRWAAIRWAGVRNYVHNAGYWKWINKPGFPLWYKTWFWRSKQYYAKAGWLSNGLPCASFGGGRGY